jgi:glycerol kinase
MTVNCIFCTSWQVYKAEDTKEIVSYSVRITQICPKEGWLEHNPVEILHAVRECVNYGVENLQKLNYGVEDIVAVGISNQRETTIAWDSATGEPLHNAIGESFLLNTVIL